MTVARRGYVHAPASCARAFLDRVGACRSPREREREKREERCWLMCVLRGLQMPGLRYGAHGFAVAYRSAAQCATNVRCAVCGATSYCAPQSGVRIAYARTYVRMYTQRAAKRHRQRQRQTRPKIRPRLGLHRRKEAASAPSPLRPARRFRLGDSEVQQPRGRACREGGELPPMPGAGCRVRMPDAICTGSRGGRECRVQQVLPACRLGLCWWWRRCWQAGWRTQARARESRRRQGEV